MVIFVKNIEVFIRKMCMFDWFFDCCGNKKRVFCTCVCLKSSKQWRPILKLRCKPFTLFLSFQRRDWQFEFTTDNSLNIICGWAYRHLAKQQKRGIICGQVLLQSSYNLIKYWVFNINWDIIVELYT